VPFAGALIGSEAITTGVTGLGTGLLGGTGVLGRGAGAVVLGEGLGLGRATGLAGVAGRQLCRACASAAASAKAWPLPSATASA
jgi:hypothetical protein